MIAVSDVDVHKPSRSLWVGKAGERALPIDVTGGTSVGADPSPET